MEAFQFAESGPKENLSRGIWKPWLQAAQNVGHKERIETLEQVLGGE